MTFIVWTAAAWRRWDEWRRDRNGDVTTWFGEMRRLPDRPLGPSPARKQPGQRYVGKHRAVPNEPVRRPS